MRCLFSSTHYSNTSNNDNDNYENDNNSDDNNDNQPVRHFFSLGFTPCKAEQPLQGMKFREKKAQKRSLATKNVYRKNLQLKDVC